MISYSICLFLSDLLHLVWQSLHPSMLQQMALFHSFLSTLVFLLLCPGKEVMRVLISNSLFLKGPVGIQFTLEVNRPGYPTSRSCVFFFKFSDSVASSEQWDTNLTPDIRGWWWRPCEIGYGLSSCLSASDPASRFLEDDSKAEQ